ncbi:MAG: hypothetical protein M0Q48_07060 [Verrucomicrobia bacterium]|nr:hypothetical protein [Verrucomicrobiota bacterium]
MKTQIELENEFAQIENEASLILKNISDCIDREEAIPEDTKNKYRETCAGLQKKSREIYSQRRRLLDKCEKPLEDEDNWRVQSMLNEIDSRLGPDAINIPQKYIKEVIAQLDKVLDDFSSFIWEPDENYRDFLKRNGLLYTIRELKESCYIDSKIEEFNAEKKQLFDKIYDHGKKYGDTNDAGTKESLLGWFDSDSNKLKIVDFVCKYLEKVRSSSDASLHNIQLLRAYLAKDKDSIRNLKISKNNEEKAESDAHDNENNVNFSLVIKDKATGKTLTSSVAGGYPLGVEGILDTFKLDGGTNEQFKFKLEVEVTKTKRKFCWDDYGDLIQYFQINQPLASKGEKRELTLDYIKFAKKEIIQVVRDKGEPKEEEKWVTAEELEKIIPLKARSIKMALYILGVERKTGGLYSKKEALAAWNNQPKTGNIRKEYEKKKKEEKRAAKVKPTAAIAKKKRGPAR